MLIAGAAIAHSTSKFFPFSSASRAFAKSIVSGAVLFIFQFPIINSFLIVLVFL
jgi:hypothetical protein